MSHILVTHHTSHVTSEEARRALSIRMKEKALQTALKFCQHIRTISSARSPFFGAGLDRPGFMSSRSLPRS